MKARFYSLLILLFIITIKPASAQVEIGLTSYPTLKAAFDDINAGIHTGNIIITILSNTIETVPAVLNASDTGAASYSSVLIYPENPNITVEGTLDGQPVIDLNGADNVTIDGRINGIGQQKDLSIINSSAAALVNTSTVRMKNDASDNVVKYCILKGSGSHPFNGVLMVSEGVVTGNNTIDISYCDFTSPGNDRPSNFIYTIGVSSMGVYILNNNLTITGNNFYNGISDNGDNGIYLRAFSKHVTITDNSFYETTPVGLINSAYYRMIHVGNGISDRCDDIVVSNNYFGGTSPQCAGNPFTVASGNLSLECIFLNTDTVDINSVQGNIITNYLDTNPTTGITFIYAIRCHTGKFNVGTAQPNIIGSTTVNNSIFVQEYDRVAGIDVQGSKKFRIENNIISGIKCNRLTAINARPQNGNDTCFVSNNIIGSPNSSNSINVYTNFYGIIGTPSGEILKINDNIIADVTNNNTVISSFDGFTNGILSEGYGNVIIERNKIKNITTYTSEGSNDDRAAIIGICNIAEGLQTGLQSINHNEITGLHNLNSSAAASMIGIFSRTERTSSINISANLIAGLTRITNNTNDFLGAISVNFDTTYTTLNCFNNIISLDTGLYGNSNEVYGIYETGTGQASTNYLFNTVYIGGHETGSEHSYCFYSNSTNAVRDIRNNIFYNHRSRDSTATGKHYTIGYAGSIGNTAINYNNYFSDGAYGANYSHIIIDQSTFAGLQVATGQDVNSIDLNPSFFKRGGFSALDYTSYAALPGIFISAITTDYNNNPRPAIPHMGALEFNCVTVNVPGITQSICMGDTFIYNGNLLTQPGTYTNNYVTSFGCDSITTLNLIVNPLPVATILVAGFNLSTQTFASYQWILNGNPISGATSQQYAVIANGTYSVSVTDSNNCSAQSDTVMITNIGINEISEQSLIISPNPVNDVLTVALDNFHASSLEVKVFNMQGALAYSKTEIRASDILSVSTSSLHDGVYMLAISTGEKTYYRKFLKTVH